MGNRNVPSEEKRQMKNKRRDCNRMSKNTSRAVLPATRGSSGVGNHAFQRGQSNANACFLFPRHSVRVAHCELSWMCSSNVIVLNMSCLPPVGKRRKGRTYYKMKI